MLIKQKIPQILIMLFLAGMIPTRAFGITVSPGQPLDFSFDQLVAADQPPGPLLDISVYWWPPTTVPGPISIDFFEDSTDELPFLTLLVATGIGAGAITIDIDQWNDLDGRIVMTAISGIHHFDSLTFGVIADGQYYARTYDITVVPLPPTLILLASSLLIIFRRTS